MALTRGKRWLFGAVAVALAFGLTFALGEVALRLAGRRPWDPAKGKLDQVVEPGGTVYAPHDSLGFALLPGRFSVKQYRITWHVTNLGPVNRLTRSEQRLDSNDARPGLWTFGDSYTYGWGVEDQETYAWILQSAQPHWQVVNHGVGGFSTVQSLIALKEALAAASTKPRLVTLGYSSFHDGRNALLRGNRKSWLPYVSRYPRFLRASLRSDGSLHYDLVPLEYTPWPLASASSLVEFLDEKFNKLQVLTSGADRISQALIADFARTCKDKGISFLLLGMHRNARTAAMLTWAQSQGIRALDIAVDLDVPENTVPGDGHPGPRAHRQFAAKLGSALTDLAALR